MTTVAITALLSAFSPAVSSAGVNRWTTNGPEGGFVLGLIIDPSQPATLYASTFSGVYKSPNGGQSWTAVNTGLPDTAVCGALAIDPSSPSTLYAGMLGGGVFKSTNGGQSWTAANIGLLSDTADAFAIDPSSPSTLYVGTQPNGVFKSTNGGESWRAVNTGLTDTFLLTLAIEPSSPSTLYAGTAYGGVFKSINGGQSWTAVNTGLTNPEVIALAIDPSSPSTLYAATFGGGVFKSTDGGQSWTAVSTGLSDMNVQALAIDPSSPSTLYAATFGGGVFKSNNGGQGWTAMNTGLTNTTVNALTLDPLSPSTLYAGTFGSGVFEYESLAPCAAGPTTLCLNGGRFRVETLFTTPQSQIENGRSFAETASGMGQVVPLTSDTGYVWFFSATNVEMVVKVLDGRALNNRFWVFAGGLTNVNVLLRVTDCQTGAAKTYTNPQGAPFQPIQDTDAFAEAGPIEASSRSPAGGSAESAAAAAFAEFAPLFDRGKQALSSETFSVRAAAACVADATTLCLNGGRYKVQTQWATPQGQNGSGQAVALTSDTGYFWFFSANNVEMVVKALNACTFNSRYWVFAGGLTSVNVVMTVTDTQTGAVKIYTNPQGTAFQPLQDTSAFPCP